MRSNSFIQSLFFGNYFLGICVVALSIETALVLNFPLQDFFYYLFAFAMSTFFYTIAYLSEPVNQHNPRTIWYAENKKLVAYSQYFLSSISVIFLIQFIFFNFEKIAFLSWEDIFLMSIFPLLSMAYYGVNSTFFTKKNIRQIGWLKPFIIGFVWAGTTTIYPLFYEKIKNNSFSLEKTIFFSHFLENMLFIAILGIMFDIKDYATDSNEKIKTFVVQHGLRATIFYIIFPLVFLCLMLQWQHFSAVGFSYQKTFVHTVPFILQLIVAYSLRQRKSILYYLFLVDGLILVKVFCTLSTEFILFHN